MGERIEGAIRTLIPIVMVLVEGGRSSIKTICEALDSNTPIVVVKVKGNDLKSLKYFQLIFRNRVVLLIWLLICMLVFRRILVIIQWITMNLIVLNIPLHQVL